MLENSLEYVLSFTFKKTATGRLSGSVGEASALGSGHDLKVLGSSPESGSLLSGESVCPSPSTPPPTHALSFK